MRILFISLILFATTPAFAKCFVVPDEADKNKLAVIQLEGSEPKTWFSPCPAGVTSEDGEILRVVAGKAEIDQAAKAARDLKISRAKADKEAAKLERKAKVDALKQLRKKKLTAEESAKAVELMVELFQPKDEDDAL